MQRFVEIAPSVTTYIEHRVPIPHLTAAAALDHLVEHAHWLYGPGRARIDLDAGDLHLERVVRTAGAGSHLVPSRVVRGWFDRGRMWPRVRVDLELVKWSADTSALGLLRRNRNTCTAGPAWDRYSAMATAVLVELGRWIEWLVFDALEPALTGEPTLTERFVP